MRVGIWKEREGIYVGELVECFFVAFEAVDEAQQESFDCHLESYSSF